VRFEREYGIG